MRELAQQFRVDSIRVAANANSGHPTSSMSAAELMSVLVSKYFRYRVDEPKSDNNDHLIFSKGHASPLYYSILLAIGAIDEKEMETYRLKGSRLEGHPTPVLPYVDVATGSLGQGLPVGVGVALAAKRLDRLDYRTWILCGDSEMAEGSIWEALAQASFENLDNLTAIVDVNRLGQTGPTRYEWDLDVYADRIRAFGWHAIEIDGHDVDAVDKAYAEAIATKGKPTAIVARTVKGKGVAWEENKNGFHGKPVDDSPDAIRELGGQTAIRINPPAPDESAKAHSFPTAQLKLPTYELGTKVATRKAYGDALAALGAADGKVVALDGEVGNSTYTETFANKFPERFFQMYIAEQQMIGRRGGHAGPWLEAVQRHVCRVPEPRLRLHPHGRGQPGESVHMRLARRRIDRRGRSVADGPRGHRRDARGVRVDGPISVRRKPDRSIDGADGQQHGHQLHPHDAPGDGGDLRRR